MLKQRKLMLMKKMRKLLNVPKAVRSRRKERLTVTLKAASSW